MMESWRLTSTCRTCRWTTHVIVTPTIGLRWMVRAQEELSRAIHQADGCDGPVDTDTERSSRPAVVDWPSSPHVEENRIVGG
jgi:hypothetical protein